MNIAYVGNFNNFGSSVSTFTTAMVYLTSELSEVKNIDVFCAYPSINRGETFIPDKVKIIPLFDPKKPLSTLNLYGIKWNDYDRIIFNVLPTSYGKSSVMNMIGLLAPYILTKLGKKNIRVVYHNSTFTNDIEKLGYNSRTDKIKKIILSRVEMLMFTSLPTYMPVKIYVNKILSKNKKAQIKFIDFRFFAGIPTIYINGYSKNDCIERAKSSKKTVLLHGYWGPQKNLELALKHLSDLRKEGVEFYLVLSGALNDNFPAYSDYFDKLLKTYSDVIDERIGYVSEKDIMKLFLRSDLVVIPYNVPGGHSGVLETAITFGNSVICLRHNEFEEQSAGFDNIILTDTENFYEDLKTCLKEKNNCDSGTSINILEKINQAIGSVRKILE